MGVSNMRCVALLCTVSHTRPYPVTWSDPWAARYKISVTIYTCGQDFFKGPSKWSSLVAHAVKLNSTDDPTTDCLTSSLIFRLFCNVYSFPINFTQIIIESRVCFSLSFIHDVILCLYHVQLQLCSLCYASFIASFNKIIQLFFVLVFFSLDHEHFLAKMLLLGRDDCFVFPNRFVS